MNATENCSSSSSRTIPLLRAMLFRTASAHDLRSSDYVRNNSSLSLLSSRSASFHRPPQRQHQQLYHRGASSSGTTSARAHSAHIGGPTTYWRPAFIPSGRCTPDRRVETDPPKTSEEAFSRHISSLSLFRRLASGEEGRDALVQRLISQVDFPSPSSSFARHGCGVKNQRHRRRTLSSSCHSVDSAKHSISPHPAAAPPPISYFCAPGKAKKENEMGEERKKKAAGRNPVHLDVSYMNSEKVVRGTGLRVQSEQQQNMLPFSSPLRTFSSLSSSSVLYSRKENGYGDRKGDPFDTRRSENINRAHAHALRWNSRANGGANPPPLAEGVAEHGVTSVEVHDKIQRKEGMLFAVHPSRRKNPLHAADALSASPLSHALVPSTSRHLHPTKEEKKKMEEEETSFRAVKVALHKLPPSLQSLVQRYGRPLTLPQLHTIATVSPSIRCDVLRMMFEGVKAEAIIHYLLELQEPLINAEPRHKRRDLDHRRMEGTTKPIPEAQRTPKNHHHHLRSSSNNSSSSNNGKTLHLPKSGSPNILTSRSPQEVKRSSYRNGSSTTAPTMGRKGVVDESSWKRLPSATSQGGAGLGSSFRLRNATEPPKHATPSAGRAASFTEPIGKHYPDSTVPTAAISTAMMPPSKMNDVGTKEGGAYARKEGGPKISRAEERPPQRALPPHHDRTAFPVEPQNAPDGIDHRFPSPVDDKSGAKDRRSRGVECRQEGEGHRRVLMYTERPMERDTPLVSPTRYQKKRSPTPQRPSSPVSRTPGPSSLAFPTHEKRMENDSTLPTRTAEVDRASSPPHHVVRTRDAMRYFSGAPRLQRDHTDEKTKQLNEETQPPPPFPVTQILPAASTSPVVPSVLPVPSPAAMTSALPSNSVLPSPHVLPAGVAHKEIPEATSAPPPLSSRSESYWRELTVSSASSSEDGDSFVSIRANRERRPLSTPRPTSCSVSHTVDGVGISSSSLASAAQPLSHARHPSTTPIRATSTNAGGDPHLLHHAEGPHVSTLYPRHSPTPHESAWDIKYKEYLHRYQPHRQPSPSSCHAIAPVHPSPSALVASGLPVSVSPLLFSASSPSTREGKDTATASPPAPSHRRDGLTSSTGDVQAPHGDVPQGTGNAHVTHVDPTKSHDIPHVDRLSRLSSIRQTVGSQAEWTITAFEPRGSLPVSVIHRVHSPETIATTTAESVLSLDGSHHSSFSQGDTCSRKPQPSSGSTISPPPPPPPLSPVFTGASSVSALESHRKKKVDQDEQGWKKSLHVFEVERSRIFPTFSFASVPSVGESGSDVPTVRKGNEEEGFSSSELAFRDLSPSVQPPPNCIRVVKVIDSPSPSIEPATHALLHLCRRPEKNTAEDEKGPMERQAGGLLAAASSAMKEDDKARRASVSPLEMGGGEGSNPTGFSTVYKAGVTHSHSPHPTPWCAEETSVSPSHRSSAMSDSDCTLSSCSRKSNSLAMFVRNNTAPPPPALDDTPPPTTKVHVSPVSKGGMDCGGEYGPHTTRRKTANRTIGNTIYGSSSHQKRHPSRSDVSPKTTTSSYSQEKRVEEKGEEDLEAPFSRIDTAPPFPLTETEKSDGPTGGTTQGRTPPRKVVESRFASSYRTCGIARGSRAQRGW